MDKLNLTCKPMVNGIMAYWAEEKNAARYIVTLYINDKDISTRVIERTDKYCTFTGLAASDNYRIKVVAEDRIGAVIVESEKFKVEVEDLTNKLDKIINAVYECALYGC